MSRYRDAYLQARVTNGIGSFIKGFGFVLGSLLILTGFLFTSKGRLGDATFALGVITIVSGIVAGVWFYIVGVLVAAQGQILKASLDGAVNNSPFLTDEQRAKIMSLPRS
jgi:VIT1/CCC1 family predicted Fe2+/Mn2+ transporter